MLQDDLEQFNKFIHAEPSKVENIIIVNEKRNPRDVWANYLARFKESKVRRYEKRGGDSMPGYLSGFSFRKRQSSVCK